MPVSTALFPCALQLVVIPFATLNILFYLISPPGTILVAAITAEAD